MLTNVNLTAPLIKYVRIVIRTLVQNKTNHMLLMKNILQYHNADFAKNGRPDLCDATENNFYFGYI